VANSRGAGGGEGVGLFGVERLRGLYWKGGPVERKKCNGGEKRRGQSRRARPGVWGDPPSEQKTEKLNDGPPSDRTKDTKKGHR